MNGRLKWAVYGWMALASGAAFGAWPHESVLPHAYFAEKPDFAFDASGRMVVACVADESVAGSRRFIKVMVDGTSGWSFENTVPVDSLGAVVEDLRLVLSNSEARVFAVIAAPDAQGNPVRRVYRVERRSSRIGDWRAVLVGGAPPGGPGDAVRMQVYPDGSVWALRVQPGSGAGARLTWQYAASASWIPLAPISLPAGETVVDVAAAGDASGVFHAVALLYNSRSSAAYSLKYFAFNAAAPAWTEETVVSPTPYPLAGPVLALSPWGGPQALCRIQLQPGSPQGLFYTVRNGPGVWAPELVDIADFINGWDLAVDSRGIPHAAYHGRKGAQYLDRYATRYNDYTFARWTVSQSYNLTRDQCLRLDAAGVPHILFVTTEDFPKLDASLIHARALRYDIRGFVVERLTAALVGLARVKLTWEGGAESIQFLSNVKGEYVFPALPSDHYSVSMDNQKGFRFVPRFAGGTAYEFRPLAQNESRKDFYAVGLYSISGRVMDLFGRGKGHLQMGLWDAGAGRWRYTTTDASGAYVFSEVASKSYTIRPQDARYTYTPASRSYPTVTNSLAAQNFTINFTPVPLP